MSLQSSIGHRQLTHVLPVLPLRHYRQLTHALPILPVYPVSSVTQLMGGESVLFTQDKYLLHVAEDAAPGQLMLLHANTLDSGRLARRS